MGPDDLLCSRNAHDQNVLIRRAQSRIDQATLENEVEDWDNTRNGSLSSPTSRKERDGQWLLDACSQGIIRTTSGEGK